MNWIQENLLALYGAIVGTTALLLSFGRFWLMYQNIARKLKVASTIDSKAQKRLDELAKPPDIFSGPRPICGPIYRVTVTNPSHVAMHINDVGLMVMNGKKKSKLKAYIHSGSHNFLYHLDDAGGDDLPAGAKKSYSVWLSGDPKIPDIVCCYAEDQLGRIFKGRHTPDSQILTVPKSACA